MKKRIISGAVFAVILTVLLLVNNSLVDTLFVLVLSLIGIFELNKVLKNVGYKPIAWIEYLGCLQIFFMGSIIPEAYKVLLIKIIVPIAIIGAFAYMIVGTVKRTVIDVALTIFAVIYVPFMFSFMKLIMELNNGRYYFMFVLCGAFVSDTFAYLIGSRFGRTKLCPEISPNKTVEGSIGGIIGVIISYTILALIGKYALYMNINVYYWVFIAIIAAIAGQFGDLTASAIKRMCKIKDFGNIMPGHGGVLDRFDSVMFVAPIVYAFIKLYI